MFTNLKLTERERFINVMEYKPVDRVPNHEAGVWKATIDQWEKEGLNKFDLHWDWWTGENYFDMDTREFIDVKYGMMPEFDEEVLEKDGEYEIVRQKNGIIVKGLVKGKTMGERYGMDQFLSFPVRNVEDFRELKKRYNPKLNARYPAKWKEIMAPRWRNREHVLVLARNVNMLGFYWTAREWIGLENLSYAFFEQPELIHEMMEFIAEYTIEISRPVLELTDVDYVFINEDMSMKNGPLLSPAQYKAFIFPHMRRMVEFFKKNNVRYVMVDTDGNCEALIPLLMDCGVDGIWPLERAANMDPVRIRREYGRDLRFWGGVDKMEIAKGKEAIDKHLAELVPIVEEGGYIPTIDHLVPPNISLGVRSETLT